jgi:hypothetical protein
VVEMSNDDICLIHCFDNIDYMARSEEGGDLPIRKFTTGEYHIEGDLVLASKERLYMYFKNCINILKLVEKLTVFFLSPLPCYLYKSCCPHLNHAPNTREEDFEERMRRSLMECCGTQPMYGGALRGMRPASSCRVQTKYTPCQKGMGG